MKKILSLALVLIIAAMALAGCGANTEAESDLAYITEKGNMVIGYTVYAPMNYTDEAGNFTGFDTELAIAVCEKLGVTPEFIEIDWDTKEVELNAKNLDCIWNGFTITEEREENLDFSKPYIENKQVVVIRKADAEKYTDAASLSAANLVAEISSAGESAIADDENLAKANYTAVAKQTDGLMEVKAGTADAVVLDVTLANAMVGEGTSYADLQIVEGLDLAVEFYGVGFRTGSDVVEKVNEAFDALIADGTMEALGAKYEVNICK
ncbi:MAG: transporter substrate-binding domain-containing protein [Clostridia bacterium]|nr:transporter substrate-binding domain-containing protein [Clostridia bacterium]